MEPLNFHTLKSDAKSALSAWQKPSGLAAAVFYLVLGALQLLVSYLAGKFISLPSFSTVEDLVQYFASGHTGTLLLLTMANLIPFFLSLLFSGIFSAYCLKISKGSIPEGKTLLGCVKLLPRYVLLFVLYVAAAFAVSFVLALLMLVSDVLAVLLLAALGVFLIVLLYALKLSHFSIAERKDCHILSALHSSIKLTNGHKKELFVLDLSFIWYYLLLSVISSVVSALPEYAVAAAEVMGNTGMVSWLTANYSLLSLIFSGLGIVAVLPVYYKFHTYVQLTYALVYQKLKEQKPLAEETQPLAYQEFNSNP